jgi:hypothetical protein
MNEQENLSGAFDYEQQQYEQSMEHQFEKDCPVIPAVEEFKNMFEDKIDPLKWSKENGLEEF